MLTINPRLQKLIPTAKANNAYDLCLEVIDAMLEEPKRVNMGYFCLLVGQGEEHASHYEVGQAPACGTIGCFAGWVNLITFDRNVANNHAQDLAKAVLGEGLRYRFAGANGRLYHYFNAGGGDGILNNPDAKPGTSEYAIAVVQRIRRFMKVNAKALKARTINARVKAAALKAVTHVSI
jgi:hypothetical protein